MSRSYGTITVGGRVYDLSDVRGSKSKKNPEGAIRYGLKKCGECRQQFTAKVGTVFEHARTWSMS